MNLNTILSYTEPTDSTSLWIDMSTNPISAKVMDKGKWTPIINDVEENTKIRELIKEVQEHFNGEIDRIDEALKAVDSSMQDIRDSIQDLDEKTQENIKSLKENIESQIQELREKDTAIDERITELEQNLKDNYVTYEYGEKNYGTLEEQKSLRTDVEELFGETAELEANKLDKTEAAEIYATKQELEDEATILGNEIEAVQNDLDATKENIENNYVKNVTFEAYKEEESNVHQTIQKSIQDTKSELETKINTKQDKLTAGEGIRITEDNVIESTLDLTIIRVVSQLPLPENAEPNKIYFVKNTVEGQSDVYIEYIVVEGKWEKLGEYKTKIDLSGYLLTEKALQMFAQVDGTNATGLWDITAARASRTIGKLTFKGYQNIEYDGYVDKVVNLPTKLSQFENDADFPTKSEGAINPYSLIFTGAVDKTYNGSETVTVAIPIIPETLPNPYALSWSGYESGSYNGSKAVSFNIPSDTSQLTNGAGYITPEADILGNSGSADLLRRNYSNSEKYSLNTSDNGVTYGSIPYVTNEGSIRLGNTLQLFDNTTSVFNVKLKGINKDEIVLNFPSKSGTFALLSDIPTNHVTLDTKQTITGEKTFDSIVNVKNGIKFIESDGKSITLSTYVNEDKDLIAIQADDFIGSFHFGNYILDRSTGTLQYDNNIDSAIDINFPTQEGTIALVSQIPTKLPNPKALKFTGALTSSYDGSAEVIINLPTKYPNPQALTFTGYSTKSYDGSTAVEVPIPTKLANPKTLSFTGQQTKTYDGSIDVSVELPTKLPNPTSLTFTGYQDKTYDGSTDVTVDIPTKLPNPNALTFKGAVTGTYDGSKATEITIPSLTGGSAAESGKYVSGVTVSGHAVTVTKGTLPVKATTTADGLMSKEDKAKLDGIASGANKYSLPLAASGTRGGVQIGYTATGSNIPVQLSSEKMYVTLTSTAMKATVSDATTDTSGWMSSADKAKLNGVASNAEVNQNAFSNVKVGTTTVAADSKMDTLELKNGTGISISANATNDYVTIGHSNSITAGTASGGSGSVTFGGSITIPSISYNAQGHITSTGTTTVTLPANPNTDTKNTAGSTNKAATKLFLIGAESQGANPQTYSNTNVYINTDNCLYSGGKKVLTDHQNLDNYALKTEVSAVQNQLNTLVENNASEVIDSFKEIEAFLQGVTNKQTLAGLLQEQLNKTYLKFNQNRVTTNKALSELNTTTGESSWNKPENTVLFLTNENNALVFHIDGKISARSANIQSGHFDTNYATSLGKLYLNYYGGSVYIGKELAATQNWVQGLGYTKNTGTVTSVGLSVPTGLTVSGSPVTTSGTLAVSLANGYVIPKQADLDKYVTLNSVQTITAKKTFSTQQAFTQASGTSPFTVTSDTVVTNLNADLLDGKHDGELTAKYFVPAASIKDYNAIPSNNGIFKVPTGNPLNGPGAGYGKVLQLSNQVLPVAGADQHWVSQIAMPTNSHIYYRERVNTSDWGSWHTIAYIDDVYTKTEANSKYVKKSGDTMTGALCIKKTGTGKDSGLIIGGPSASSNSNIMSPYLNTIILNVKEGGDATKGAGIVFHNNTISTASIGYYNESASKGHFKFNSDDDTWDVLVKDNIVFTSDGKVGIGTTTPSAKLHVMGTVYASDMTTAKGFKIPNGTSSQFLKADGSVSTLTATATKGDTAAVTFDNATGKFNFTLPKGDTGAQGPKGETGAVGPQGPAGATGAKGDTWVPSVSSTGKLTWTKNGSTNPTSVNIKGPKGDTGAKGDKGEKGDTGLTGATGPAGPKGDKGDTGAQGLQGPKGDAGPAGPTGAQGPAGKVWKPTVSGNTINWTLGDAGSTTTLSSTLSIPWSSITDKPTIPSAYTLPIASSSRLGGIKVGTNLSISSDGTLSVPNMVTLNTDQSITGNKRFQGLIGIGKDEDLNHDWIIKDEVIPDSTYGNFIISLRSHVNNWVTVDNRKVNHDINIVPEVNDNVVKYYMYINAKRVLTTDDIANYYTKTEIDKKKYLTSILTATSTVLGGIKLGSDTVQTVAANSVTSTTGKTYAIQENSNGQLVVNVPWTDNNTWRPVYINTTQVLSNATSSGNLVLKAGTGINITKGTDNSVNFAVNNVPWSSVSGKPDLTNIVTYSNYSSDTVTLKNLQGDSFVNIGNKGDAVYLSGSDGNGVTLDGYTGYIAFDYVNGDNLVKLNAPTKSGTIALTSDIPNVSNYVKKEEEYILSNYNLTTTFGKLDTQFFGIKVRSDIQSNPSYIGLDGTYININSNFIRLTASLDDGNIIFNRQPQVNSDERLKENIITVNNDDPRLSYAASIKLKNFNYKGSHLSTMGYIAQDVQKVLPNLVSEDKEGYLSLNYTELLLLKVAALERENIKLKERINSLEERLNKLEEIINNII